MRTLRIFVAETRQSTIADFRPIVAEALQRASERLGIEWHQVRANASLAEDPTQHVIGKIEESDAMVADASGPSPWVVWELGVAQALRKPTVVIASKADAVPPSTRGQRLILHRSVGSLAGVLPELTDAIVYAGRAVLSGASRNSLS